MERFFVLDKYNTWYDWRLVLTAKDVTPPEPKTMYVDIEGMNGTLDLSESLTGGTVYNDRTVTAEFWTCEGSRKDRSALLKDIVTALHGKKIRIVEPDDPDHFFLGRVRITGVRNIVPYAEFTLQAVCEPWRYAINDTERTVVVDGSSDIKAVIRNNGVKTVVPTITVKGEVAITYGGIKTELIAGSYKMPSLKLYHGVNVVTVSGEGSVTFVYKEADL